MAAPFVTLIFYVLNLFREKKKEKKRKGKKEGSNTALNPAHLLTV